MINLLIRLKENYKVFAKILKENKPEAIYRVVDIEVNELDEYTTVVQMVNKSHIFRMKPEEILSNDKLTDSFSSRDIRTLTYLGYLGINSPKYKILAKRLSEQDNRLVFAIREKGNTKPVIKSATEISNDKDLLDGLDQKDAHMVGYVSASEHEHEKERQKAELLLQLKKQSA